MSTYQHSKKSILDKNALSIKINSEMAVRSCYDSRLVYFGASGKRYEWGRGGDVMMVLAEDVPALLEKRIGERACCGAVQQSNKVFELVK